MPNYDNKVQQDNGSNIYESIYIWHKSIGAATWKLYISKAKGAQVVSLSLSSLGKIFSFDCEATESTHKSRGKNMLHNVVINNTLIHYCDNDYCVMSLMTMFSHINCAL